jgi:hypothetical protein
MYDENVYGQEIQIYLIFLPFSQYKYDNNTLIFKINHSYCHILSNKRICTLFV